MDPTRFDTLSRSLSSAPSRRSALRLGAGLLLGRPLALSLMDAEAHNALKKCKKIAEQAKRKKCVKKAKKHNAQHTNQTPAPAPTPVVRVFATPGAFMYTTPVAGTLRIDAFGAGGGRGGDGGDGVGGDFLIPGGAGGDPGAGGHVTASVVVAAGEEFQINVGLAGGAGTRGKHSEEGGQGGAPGDPGFPLTELPGDFGDSGGANSGGGGGGGGGGGANGGVGGGGGPGGPTGLGGTLNGGVGEAGDEGATGADGGLGGPATRAIGPPGALLTADQQTGNGRVILTLTPA